ncbi:MAG TPA: hypothetical protein VKD00_06600, partial [Methyloceanibacter sp.]|nr:hypothetical protein [Methyloceanibacter sp.]
GVDVALVYYADHGMSFQGKNLIAPTDMEVACEDKTTLRSRDFSGTHLPLRICIGGSHFATSGPLFLAGLQPCREGSSPGGQPAA